MELKTYVAETLTQIVDGIIIAQQDLKEKKAIVNPPTTVESKGLFYEGLPPHRQKTVQMVEFEVILGQTEGVEAKGSIGVFFASIGVGAQGKTETGSSATNKIKFSIPIVFPAYEK